MYEYQPETVEVYSTGFISRMLVPDSVNLVDYLPISDKWRSEWNAPVQVPSKKDGFTPAHVSFRAVAESDLQATFKFPKQFIE